MLVIRLLCLFCYMSTLTFVYNKNLHIKSLLQVVVLLDFTTLSSLYYLFLSKISTF